MKTVELILMVLIATATTLNLVPSSVTRLATSTVQPLQVDHEEQSTETQAPKDVFVNVRVFFEKHYRAKPFKADFDRALAAQKPKLMKLQNEIRGLELQLRGMDLSPADAARCQGMIKAHRRDIEDILLELDDSFGKRRVEIWELVRKDLDNGIDAMTKAYGLKAVMRVGQPDNSWSISLYRRTPWMRLDTDNDNEDSAPPGFMDITEAVLSAVIPWCCVRGNERAEQESK